MENGPLTSYILEYFDKSISRKNLKEKFEKIGLYFISLNQVHGNKILIIEKGDSNNLTQILAAPPVADACISNLDNMVLSVHTADCQPVLAYSGEWFGVCHAGWRGLANGI